MRRLARINPDVLTMVAVICLAAVANADPPANLQEGPGHAATAREEPTLVVGVDVPALARAVYGEGATEIGDFAATEHGVVRRFSLGAGERDVEVTLGIYHSAQSAEAAFWRGLPPVVHMTEATIGDQRLLVGKTLQVRQRNLLLRLEVGLDPADDTLARLGNSIQASFGDPSIMRHGVAIDLPEVKILAAKGDVRGYCDVVLTIENDRGDCLLVGGRRGPEDAFRVSTKKSVFDREFTVRAIRKTGEIVEIPASEFPSEAWENWKEPERSGMTPAERATIVEKLRGGEGNPRERAQMMVRLAQDPGEDLADFFREAIETEKDSVIRCYALRGLANAEAGDGLEIYRHIVGDGSAPELLRRDAVLLIMEYGEPGDLPLLERTLADEQEKEALSAAVTRALRQLEARAALAE